MEDTLRGSEEHRHKGYRVLILVLMEDTLRELKLSKKQPLLVS